MAASDNFFSKAEQALKKRNYDYAIALYQQGLAIDPDRLEERRKLRAASIRKIQESGGSTTGGGAFKLKNMRTIGGIKKLGMQKKYEEQIVELEKILTLAPQNSDSLMGLADAFMATERNDSARQAYQEVVEIDPGNTDAWKALGRLYESEKDFEKAVECWERVKQVRPDDAEAGKAIRDLSAAVMMQRTEARQAKSSDDDFRAMLKDEDESEKLQKKTQMIRTADDAQVAIQFKKQEIEKEPENSRLWRELGDLHAKIKEFDLAEEAYRKASEVNAQDMYAAEKMGQLKEQRIVAQIDEAKAKLASSPDDAGAKAALDNALAEQNEFLLTEYDRRVAAHPTDFALKSKFGNLLLKNERYDEAIAQFQNARKDPKFAIDAHFKIGRAFFAKNLFDLAIKEYNQALVGITDHDSGIWKEVTYYLADGFVAKGELQKALELFEGIMAVDIGYRDVSQRVDEVRKKSQASE